MMILKPQIKLTVEIKLSHNVFNVNINLLKIILKPTVTS